MYIVEPFLLFKEFAPYETPIASAPQGERVFGFFPYPLVRDA